MIQIVDRAVERFLRQSVPLPEGAVDISFDAPDRTWGAALTRPTINVFLWEVARNPAFLRAGMQQRIAPQGRVERRQATPVVDLHYLLTAWASEQSDEHQLLGSVLTTILAHTHLPTDALPDGLAGSRVGLGLAPYEKRVPGEFWSALDGRLKPGLQLELNLPVEVFAWQQAASPVESVAARTGRLEHTGPQERTGPREQTGPQEQTGQTEPPGRNLPRVSVPAEPPALRRRRAGGFVVMEGRPESEIGPESEPDSGDP